MVSIPTNRPACIARVATQFPGFWLDDLWTYVSLFVDSVTWIQKQREKTEAKKSQSKLVHRIWNYLHIHQPCVHSLCFEKKRKSRIMWPRYLQSLYKKQRHFTHWSSYSRQDKHSICNVLIVCAHSARLYSYKLIEACYELIKILLLNNQLFKTVCYQIIILLGEGRRTVGRGDFISANTEGSSDYDVF